MRTRDEVLLEFRTQCNCSVKFFESCCSAEYDTIHRMADRIRELEAQLALPPIREKFVRVSDELVDQLKAAPSKPVTVAIVEDGNELHMTFREAQQAASEPVACRCGKCSGLGLVDVDLSDKAHPSAAGVTVTEAVDRIIYSLDEYARELDAHDYGLPVYGAPERMVRMRELIVTILTAASDAVCSACHGEREVSEHECCGNSTNGECCGQSVEVRVPCLFCGDGTVNAASEGASA